MEKNRFRLLDIPFDLLSKEGILSQIQEALQKPAPKTIFSVNPEKIMRAYSDHKLKEALEHSDFLIPDGVGVVLASKLFYGKKTQRIAGIELMEQLVALAASKDKSVFFFGGEREVLEKSGHFFKKKFPNLKIAGSQNGYLAASQYPELIEQINALSVDFLFVGLGSPKQELWLHEHRKDLKVRVAMSVGGSFDVFAGKVKRAPRWIQKIGCEWFFRLLQEPSRFRRQLVLPRFVFEVFREKFLRRQQTTDMRRR